MIGCVVMAVLCPQHKLSLVIVKRQIEIGGKLYPSTIGRCPQCRFAYINRKIFPGDNTTIGDETYQFLHELSIEFPPENVRNVEQEKKKEVKSKEQAKQEKKKAQKQEKKTKQNKKEKKTPTVRFAYHSNLQSTAPINMTVNYISYKIKRCPIDKCTLENKYISISVNGTVVKEVALVCPCCREAFINDTRRADIEKRVGEKKEVVTDQHKSQSKPKKQVTENEKTPANSFSYSSILQQLPLLEGNRGDCPFCKTALNNINVKYYMFGERDKPALRYTYAWGCKNCEAVYLDNSQLEDVRRYSNKKRIYTIHASAYMDAKEMMKATKHSRSRCSLSIPY